MPFDSEKTNLLRRAGLGDQLVKELDETEDPRKTGLKDGLRQLNVDQLRRVMYYGKEMVLDTYNYQDGKFCPLAVACKLDETMTDPSHEKVYEELVKLGYKVYNTRGIEGEFYTTNRAEDLQEAALEVFYEKVEERLKEGKCDCLARRLSCGVCEGGYHIFCNHFPHGDHEEAHRWFKENPEITKSIIALTDPGGAHAQALAEILEEEKKK